MPDIRRTNFDAQFESSWKRSMRLTPRQACAIASTLTFWANYTIGTWLQDTVREPLHTIAPFDGLDPRVMMWVGESHAWATEAAERCSVVASDIRSGILPFDRPCCLFDAILIALALPSAEQHLQDEPDMYEGIAARSRRGNRLGDQDWVRVLTHFNDINRWEGWLIPLRGSKNAHFPEAIAGCHPYTWFDMPR